MDCFQWNCGAICGVTAMRSTITGMVRLTHGRHREVDVAQKVTVTLEDDLDGGPADETMRFGFEGADYEIDLSSKNARAFRRQLTPFIDHARKAGRGLARRAARTTASRQRSGDIRAWAKDHGIAVSDRGRIPASVVEQYQVATKGR